MSHLLVFINNLEHYIERCVYIEVNYQACINIMDVMEIIFWGKMQLIISYVSL